MFFAGLIPSTRAADYAAASLVVIVQPNIDQRADLDSL